MCYRKFSQSFHFQIFLITIGIAFGLSGGLAQAAQVHLAWNASTSSTGYKLHYGTNSGAYNQTVDVGNQTDYLLTGLADGTTYYFSATAYNSNGTESGYSNEVNYTTAASSAGSGSSGTTTSSGTIVDNGGAGTSATGTWNTSGGANPYGASSLYSNSGATYTFQAAANGNTEVSMWWTEYNNRATSVPVEIYDGNTLIDTVYVNQQTNGGQWNLLGTYSFSGTARVVIDAGSDNSTTTCADAVKFTVN